MNKAITLRRRLAALGAGAMVLSVLAPATPSWANDAPQVKAEDAPLVQQFEDVPDNNTFAEFINSLFVSGIISGYPCGGPGEPCGPNNLPYYRPGATVTRGQMAKFVDNVRHLPNIAISTETHPQPIAASTGNVNGVGVIGVHSATGGVLPGVLGATNSTAANAVGVRGDVTSTAPGAFSAGVRGMNNSTSNQGTGVYGSHAGSGWGVYGTSASGIAVNGTTPSGVGVAGTSNSNVGVRGTSTSSTGVRGVSTSSRGVHGESTTGDGVYGESEDGIGVYGYHTDFAGTDPGVYGVTTSNSADASGVLGESVSINGGNGTAAVRGINYSENDLGSGVEGVHQGGGYGVRAFTDTGIGVWSESNYIGVTGVTYGDTTAAIAVQGMAGPDALAGRFSGDVEVTGTCCASAMGTYRMDHPMNPENQYLTHAAVASDELTNIYNGMATLDASGSAIVQMPEWFSTVNSSFRYQLTAIGGAAPNLHIAQKIEGNQFKIAGGSAGLEVSWQVTGVRTDPYAEANRPVVESDKPAEEKGTYLHPEVYGQPDSKALYQLPERSEQK